MELERVHSLPDIANKQGQALSLQGSASLDIVSLYSLK